MHRILLSLLTVCTSLGCDDPLPGQFGIYPSECSFWMYSGRLSSTVGEIASIPVTFSRDCSTSTPLKTIFSNGMQTEETEISGTQPPALGPVGSKTMLDITSGCDNTMKVTVVESVFRTGPTGIGTGPSLEYLLRHDGPAPWNVTAKRHLVTGGTIEFRASSPGPGGGAQPRWVVDSFTQRGEVMRAVAATLAWRAVRDDRRDADGGEYVPNMCAVARLALLAGLPPLAGLCLLAAAALCWCRRRPVVHNDPNPGVLHAAAPAGPPVAKGAAAGPSLGAAGPKVAPAAVLGPALVVVPSAAEWAPTAKATGAAGRPGAQARAQPPVGLDLRIAGGSRHGPSAPGGGRVELDSGWALTRLPGGAT